MSCSVHDAVRLERLGIPTAAVGTEPFVDEALEQARLLGMPAYRMTLIPHPVQLLTTAELHALADAALPGILSRLLAPKSVVFVPPLPVVAPDTAPVDPRPPHSYSR